MNNKTNQTLMWKYKETFVFPDLGSSEEDGELEFVLAIVDQNEKIATSKNLNLFVSCLNKRMGNQSNFVILLDIFNKLMDFESMGKIKKSLIKLILGNKDMLNASNSTNSAEFEASINVKEILVHILKNQELSYTRDSFVECFPLEEMIDRLKESLNALNHIQSEEEDEDQDEQEYEEFRESHQMVMVELYSILHLDKSNENLDFDTIVQLFNEKIQPFYNERLDYFINKVDLEKREDYKLSEIKLLVLHLQILVKNIAG